MSNLIHPTAVLGDGVVLGTGNVVGPHVVLEGPLLIGDDNWIGPHASLGLPGQWSSANGASALRAQEGAGVEIGSHNTIREAVTVHQGSQRATQIGDGCYLMAYAHVAHDSLVDDGVVMANAVQLAGFTVVGEHAYLALGVVVHQFSVIGAHAMVGMNAVVTSDVPPGATAFGVPARVRGVNRVGLERRGLSDEVDEAERRLLAWGARGDAGVPQGIDASGAGKFAASWCEEFSSAIVENAQYRSLV